ncbi:MAG: hypothetical protein HY808_03385 [Nitrospirae bacterium]|nr:hypothetical protein [Nitrospirota bacterium]
MKHISNDAASFHCSEDILPSLARFCEIIKRYPISLEPYRGINEKAQAAFQEGGFQLYSTVKKTTLVYDPSEGCFIKVLHPLNIKDKISFLFSDKASAIYNISEQLLSKGVKAMKVTAYGSLKKGRQPFFAVKKAEGESLYDIMIRGKRTLDTQILKNVLDEVAGLHRLGYWFGDAHLSHIFIKDTGVSALIDIDGIRRNRPYMLKRLAKDIAGLNHPELPLTKDEKRSLLNYYVDAVGIDKKTTPFNSPLKKGGQRGVKKKFIQLLKYYTERRWKD